MKPIRDLDDLPDRLRFGAVAIGNFDGVHLGHAEIIRRLCVEARQIGGPAVVFTFDPHPAAVLHPTKPPLPLTTLGRKTQLLADLGADAIIAYSTDLEMLKLSPRDFFERVVVGRLRARALVEGQSFTFGRNREGDIRVLADLCREKGIALAVPEPVQVDGQPVSSSRIRAELLRGRVELCRRLLARPHRVGGRVIRGAGRGRQLGYPTANLGGADTLLPGDGIYAGLAQVDDRAWPAAISVGPNLTFGDGTRKVEVHLIGFDGGLYDRQLEVDFLARLRDVQRFGSVEELVDQLDRDIDRARTIVAQAA